MKRVPIQIRVPIISDKQDCCPYEKPFGYIYMIINKINGHYYIGKHIYDKPWLDTTYKGSGRKLWKAYKKYGIRNFSTIILEWTNKNNDELNKLEKYWIYIFGSYVFPQHYNLTEGGDDAPVMYGEDNYMYGKIGEHNPMHQRMLLNNPMKNPNIAKKMSKNRKGKGSENNCMKRPEIRERFTGESSPVSKSVVQVTLDGEFVRFYESTSWVKSYGFVYEEVSKCCRGIRETYKGYKWIYKEDYENLINM